MSDSELPYPPEEELPADWRHMDWVERAMFVYQWRVERGYLPRPHWVSELVLGELAREAKVK